MAAVVLLTSCNGPTDLAGIQGSGSPTPATATTVQGRITGFGSIFVDGVEYSTAGAQISIDGQAATEAQLGAGQIVSIQGSVNTDGTTGTANQVTFNGDVQGPVTQVDVSAGTFLVLGQTVKVTTSTLLDSSIQPSDITGFQLGTIVEVSGFADATGAIVASRVEIKSANANFQVRGVAQGLDAASHTFRINGLTIDDSSAMVTGSLANGSTVLVQGTSVSSSGVLLATHIEVLPGSGAAVNQRADIEGIITTFQSSASFVVDGQLVTTSASTNLVLHGAQLAANILVDVQGQFDSAGTLVAQKVEVRPQGSSLVSGMVDSVSASGNTLTILGVSITTSTSTVFDDKSNQHVRMFRLSDVQVGDYVEVSGAWGTSGPLSASVVQRQNNAKSIVVGVATNLAQPNFTVLGITITTNGQTTFPSAGGPASNPTAFFSNAANHVVQVVGTYANGTLTASQARIIQ
jgi:hypothetical protein